jgi:hypothetical protein
MSAWTAVHRMAKPPERLVRLVLESHDGTALVPIPERSTSPRATSTLYRWGSLIALDPNRPIREEKRTSLSVVAMSALCQKMLWGGGEDIASIVADVNRWSAPCRT